LAADRPHHAHSHTLRTKFRVNAALANIKEFGAAWGCKAGRDKMSRGNESCIIW
jgi:predicted metalloendopeptidase